MELYSYIEYVAMYVHIFYFTHFNCCEDLLKFMYNINFMDGAI